jgi:hypothetical protein
LPHELEETAQIEICNNFGVIFFSKIQDQKNKIDLNFLTPGIYFITVKTSEKQSKQKIIKN